MKQQRAAGFGLIHVPDICQARGQESQGSAEVISSKTRAFLGVVGNKVKGRRQSCACVRRVRGVRALPLASHSHPCDLANTSCCTGKGGGVCVEKRWEKWVDAR